MKLIEVAMFTDDVDAMAARYEALLGVAPSHRGEDIAVFHRDGVEHLIHVRYAPGPGDLEAEDHRAYRAADLDTDFARLRAAGWTVEHPPKAWDWGRSAYLRDPDGRLVELQDAP